MPIYRMIRKIVSYEEVEVEANSETEAMLIAIDDEDVNVLSQNDGDYEVDFNTIYEVKEP